MMLDNAAVATTDAAIIASAGSAGATGAPGHRDQPRPSAPRSAPRSIATARAAHRNQQADQEQEVIAAVEHRAKRPATNCRTARSHQTKTTRVGAPVTPISDCGRR
jgi:hypothetical protein